MDLQIKGGHAEELESALKDGRLNSEYHSSAILCAAEHGKKACFDVLLRYDVSVNV